MSVLDMLNSTVKIERNTPTQDAIGGKSDSFATIAAAQPCRINRKTHREVDGGGKIVFRTTARFYMEADADCLEDDKLTISGEVWRAQHVDDVDNETSGDVSHLEVDCVEYDG